MKFCLEKSTFSFGLSQNVNNNIPQAIKTICEFQYVLSHIDHIFEYFHSLYN